MNYILNAYALQDIGHRSNQEDHFYPPFIDPCHYDETKREWSHYDGTPHTDDRLFIVCDGMGGHARGEVASRIVTQTMSRAILSAASIEGSFNDSMIRDAVDKALKKLVAEDDPKEIKKMGTTMTVLKFHANGVTIGHIGDSRVYHFRPSQKGQPARILFRTKDHTLINDLMANGQMSYEQAQAASSKHVLTRSMTSAIGYHPEVEIDHITDIQRGDVFMLCTDGVYENMNDEAICALLTDPNIADVQRVQSILHECIDNTDNHTAIVIRVQDVLNITDEKKTYNAALAPGTVLKSKNYTYHIEKVLGKGAFGITYLVNTNVSMQGQLGTIHTGVQVALKEFYMPGEMKREGGELIEISPESKVKMYADKFRREASKLAMLSHPNIVRVLEVFEANNTIYYSMEYLGGGSLNDYVTQKGGLPEQEAIGYIRQIGSALMYLHTNRMLHLDIKPSNVMRSTMSDMLKLIDFGLAKQYVDNGDPETSTNLGVGTTGYAPLEQADLKSDREFSPQLDVYALGATYYKLLTAHTPASAISVLNRGLNTMPLVKKKVTQQSIDAIKAAMEPIQDKRLKSVAAFLDMLPRVDDETIFASKKKHHMRYWLMLLLAISIIGICFDRFTSRREALDEDLPNMESVVISNVDMPMISVEGGSFMMGCSETDNPDVDPDEKPQRLVTVSSFYMGKYEVTQGLWRAVMEGGNAHKSKNDSYPMVNVTWKEIQTFIKRLNKQTGRRFRLPTEAEWEYAARGGNRSKEHTYSGSCDLEEVAWFSDNSGDRVHPVGSLKPNELGIYDMSGNVWEFCSDWYGDYEGDSLVNPKGCESGYYHVIRGGDWNGSKYSCRNTCRQDNSLQSIGAHIGLRLVESK